MVIMTCHDNHRTSGQTGLTKSTSLDEFIDINEVTLTNETTKHPQRYNHTSDEGKEVIQYSQ